VHFAFSTSVGGGYISLAAKCTLAITARVGKTPSVRKRNGSVVGTLPQAEELVRQGLVVRRRIFLELTPAGIEACDALGIARNYYPSTGPGAAPYTGSGPIDPVGYELDAAGRIPAGPPLDLRRG
jgi:hypothetical protein